MSRTKARFLLILSSVLLLFIVQSISVNAEQPEFSDFGQSFYMNLPEDALVVEYDPLADDDDDDMEGDEDDDDDAMIVEADPKDPDDIDQYPDDDDEGGDDEDDSDDDDGESNADSLTGGCLGGIFSCAGCDSDDDDDDDGDDENRCIPDKIRMYISNVQGPAEHTVEFRDLTDVREGCEITNRLWIYGDGVQENGNEITEHTYTDVGEYEVSLVITNPAGNFSVTGPVVVQCPLPQADFEPDTETAGPGDLIQFYDMSESYPECPLLGWEWDFGDDTEPVFDPNPVHSYEKAGIYTVSMTVFNDGGSDTMVRNSLIYVACDAAQADFRASEVAGQAPLVVHFEDLTVTDPRCPIVAWYWDFGDDTSSTEQNPVHIYYDGGLRTVTMIVTTSDGIEYSVTKSEYVNVGCPPPAPDFITDTRVGDSPLTVSFYDRTTTPGGCPITGRLWMFGDGTIVPDIEDPVHTYELVGPKTVTLIAENSGGTASIIKNAYVLVTCPDPEVDFIADKTSGPAPLEVNFTDLSQTIFGCGIFAWEWDFGDGGTSDEINPTYIYENEGIYDVTLTAYNLGGSSFEIKEGYIIVVERP